MGTERDLKKWVDSRVCHNYGKKKFFLFVNNSNHKLRFDGNIKIIQKNIYFINIFG